MGLSELVCLSSMQIFLLENLAQKTSSVTYNMHNTDMAIHIQSSAMCTDATSQTQEETQLTALANLTLNEQCDQDANRPRKRVKISVAMGVDLAE